MIVSGTPLFAKSCFISCLVGGVVDGIECDYENAKAVTKAMAERDPEVRLH